MSDIRDDAVGAFEVLFGGPPDGVWSAPGRVNLIGEHTDYNEGFVFPFAIGRRTLVALRAREDRMLRVASAYADELVEVELAELAPTTLSTSADGAVEAGLTGPGPEGLSGWSAYPLGIVWALGQCGADLAAVPGVDIFIDSDVPVGAGLSSSAAIECAVALALNDTWQLGFEPRTLARVGQLAENTAVGAPTGIMDQTASLLGEPDCAVFLDCRSGETELVNLGLSTADLRIMVIDTEQSHNLAEGSYGQRRSECEEAARILGLSSLRDLSLDELSKTQAVLGDVLFRRARHVVTENQRVLDLLTLLRTEGPNSIGPILDASHRSMRDDFEISTRELDLAVETANANGALGARMTGGGFGGAAIALIPGHAVSLLRVAIDGAFAEHGYGQPDIFEVAPSSGAGRES